MTKLENNFHNYAIDSCKVRIKFEHIEILNSDILDEKAKIIISTSSGEILSEEKIKSFSTEIHFDAYKIRIALVSYYNFQKKEQEEFLEIYLHSKILESDYFQGITKENIKVVYDRLMAQKVFLVSYKNFVSSCVNDIDFKVDFKTDRNSFETYCKEMFNRSLESKKLEVGGKLWDNGNLTFNRRESGTLAHPFVKYYNKQLECDSKNADFFNRYIEMGEYHNRRRLEVTIKKSAEIKKVFDLPESNLNSLLLLTQEQMDEYCVTAIKKNLIKTCKVEKSAISNNNLETLIHIHFSNSMNNQGQTFMQTLSSFLEHFEGDKQNKYRMKLKAQKWYEKEENSTDKNVSEEVERLLKLFRIDS